MGKVKVYRSGSRWRVASPPFGFLSAPRVLAECDTHEQALKLAFGYVTDRRAPQQAVGAAVSTEGWTPWTLRGRRI